MQVQDILTYSHPSQLLLPLDHPNVSPCGCFFAQKAIADSFVKDWTGPAPAEHDQVLSIVLPIVSKFSIWVSVETPMNQPIVSFG